MPSQSTIAILISELEAHKSDLQKYGNYVFNTTWSGPGSRRASDHHVEVMRKLDGVIAKLEEINSRVSTLPSGLHMWE